MSGEGHHVIDLDDDQSIDEFLEELGKLREQKQTSSSVQSLFAPTHINADEGNVEQGLAKLVLSLIELLRQLLEKQALRRMESGTLTDDEIERLGVTFMKLQQRITELKESFGLEDEDLNIDLGPLGNLLEDQRTRRPPE
jgi:hypothetical protein